MKTSAIIVAAGSGSRFGGPLPKQFQQLQGQSVVSHTLARLSDAAEIDEIVVVVASPWVGYTRDEILAGGRFPKVQRVVAGGLQRQDSVLAGLEILSDSVDIVLVHDAVRPLISTQKVREVIAAAQQYGAAVLALQPKDTVKRAKGGMVQETLDRNSLWLVQTPQAFKRELLAAAHAHAQASGTYRTDDAALVEHFGKPVKIVEGDRMNIKLTVPDDFLFAEHLLGTAVCE